jgi:hypothetical protein
VLLKPPNVAHLDMLINAYLPGCEYWNAHAVDMRAGSAQVWGVLPDVFPSMFAIPLIRAALGMAALVRLERPRRGPARAIRLKEGESEDGFRVDRIDEGREVVFTGSHRYSQYAVNLYIESLSNERTRLYMVTRAYFPGFVSRLYFIGVRLFHDRIVEGGLRRAKRRIEAIQRPLTGDS